MRSLIPLLIALSGCSHDVERDAIAAEPTRVQTPRRGSPHGGSIREVAVTEGGEAAISVDQQGGIRVWPALDGSREAVPVIAPVPVAVAIARHGDEVVAGLIDEAGSAQVLRVGRDGRLRGRVAVAGEVRIEQIVARGDGLVVRRADQSLERLDGNGVMRGRLVAEPGEQIAALAVRGDAAIALIAGTDGTSSRMRWIERDFTWGAQVTLPSQVWPESVALSPSHKRLAGAEGKSRQLFVFDLTVKPAVVLGTSVTVAVGEPTGFIDEDHVVAMGESPRWWTSLAQPNVDPWAPTTPPNPPPGELSGSIGAAATGFMVAGSGASLALITPSRVRYLGWHDIGSQGEVVLGTGIAVTVATSRLAWLDNALVAQHVATVGNGHSYVQAIDDRHIVIERQQDSVLHVAMIDIDHPEHEVELGVFTTIQRFDYEPRTHVFGIGDGTVEHRYALDPGHGTVNHLADLPLRTATSVFRLLDPELAGGAVAAQAVTEPNSHVEVVREGRGKIVASRGAAVPGYVFAIDDRGQAYSRDGASTLFCDTTSIVKNITDTPVPDHDGGAIATIGANGVTLYDAAGGRRWRLPIWGAASAAFTSDDAQLIVRAPGELVAIDVANGTRVASACGWGFGLYDTPPTGTPMGQGSVCEDDE